MPASPARSSLRGARPDAAASSEAPVPPPAEDLFSNFTNVPCRFLMLQRSRSFEALCFDFGIELDDVTTKKAILPEGEAPRGRRLLEQA
ncbi:hypothetical protein EJB05_01375, partial [Eragrostis curvula]